MISRRAIISIKCPFITPEPRSGKEPNTFKHIGFTLNCMRKILYVTWNSARKSLISRQKSSWSKDSFNSIKQTNPIYLDWLIKFTSKPQKTSISTAFII